MSYDILENEKEVWHYFMIIIIKIANSNIFFKYKKRKYTSYKNYYANFYTIYTVNM